MASSMTKVPHHALSPPYQFPFIRLTDNLGASTLAGATLKGRDYFSLVAGSSNDIKSNSLGN